MRHWVKLSHVLIPYEGSKIEDWTHLALLSGHFLITDARVACTTQRSALNGVAAVLMHIYACISHVKTRMPMHAAGQCMPSVLGCSTACIHLNIFSLQAHMKILSHAIPELAHASCTSLSMHSRCAACSLQLQRMIAMCAWQDVSRLHKCKGSGRQLRRCGPGRLALHPRLLPVNVRQMPLSLADSAGRVTAAGMAR